MTSSIELSTIQVAIRKSLEKFIGHSMNNETLELMRQSVVMYLNTLEKGIDMEQIKFRVESDNDTGTVHIAPENEYTECVLKFLATSPKIP